MLKKYVSLTVGRPYRLPVKNPSQYSFDSNNPFVIASTDGYVYADKNAVGEKANALVTLVPSSGEAAGNGNNAYEFHITIVNWVANHSSLFRQKYIEDCARVLGCYEDAVYYYHDGKIRKTADGFETSDYVSDIDFEPGQSPMLKTPCGFVIRSGNELLRSHNLVEWEVVACFKHGGLYHSLDYSVGKNGVVVYVCEYSVDVDSEHSVHKVFLSNEGGSESKTILTFSPHSYREQDLETVHARHIHAVSVDPYTGDVWVATGDLDNQSMLLYSSDEGETFTFVGGGSQDWRALAVFFTDKYIYWNMDTSSPQKVWRVSRDALLQKRKYNVIKGEYINSYELTICNGSEFGFEGSRQPEIVAELENGSFWFQSWVKDNNGNSIALLSGSPEGHRRDWMGRVFGIKECSDGQCDVQELLAIPPRSWSADASKKRRTRLDPLGQDSNGYIYFNGLFVKHRGVNRFQLEWNDVKVESV